ncbi:hypothetical protein [Curtanaerobium respiraculi]|uniref:hypothetical protein n=1 Tax=Curtanaerobium respiraculi TaxID=2949669 RepID=UPI0024B35E75|nr:hypothetical protein [Curtanaerobium respiraculi]
MDAQDIVKRSEHCVCKMCGGKLEARIVIYNKYGGQGVEMFCPTCGRIEYGAEAEVYRLAKDFVRSVEFDYFTEMEEGERNFQMNVAKVSEMLGWCLRKLEVLDSEGVRKQAVCNFDYQDEH